MSNPRGSEDEQLVAEDIGAKAAENLLNEIYRVRKFNIYHFKIDCFLFSGRMSRYVCTMPGSFFYGAVWKGCFQIFVWPFVRLHVNLTYTISITKIIFSIHTLRNLKLFFGHVFKIDELWKIKRTEAEDDAKGQRLGSEEKALMTCVGVGYFNINKILLWLSRDLYSIRDLLSWKYSNLIVIAFILVIRTCCYYFQRL